MNDEMIIDDENQESVSDFELIDGWIFETLKMGAAYVGMTRDEIMTAVIYESYRGM